jgi:hypothetical protein
MTCMVHSLDSVQGAPGHEEIVKTGHFSPDDPSRQTVCPRPTRRGGTYAWDPSPFRGPPRKARRRARRKAQTT